MTSSVVQKFVLVGKHRGKSKAVNGHEFVDGIFVYQGSAHQVESLRRVLRHYGAVTAEQAELVEAKERLASLETPADSSPSVGGSMDTPTPTGPVRPTLAEAIGQLSWEQETHWTSNNLPSLDALGEITGKKVTRGDVEAVAAGYTRAKAKSVAAA